MNYEENGKNLKGRIGKLTYYRKEKTGEFEKAERIVDGVKKEIINPIMKTITFEEDQVRAFSLDKHGKSLPYVHGHNVIINEYVYDFWGHFLQAEGLALYGHLLRHCYGDKNWCFPEIDLLAEKMGKSRNTVKKFLAILEEYGFAYRFLVKNPYDNKKDESPLFKVRKKVPFLSKELIEKLPPRLKKEHDKYLHNIGENHDEDVSLDDNTDYGIVYQSLIEKGVTKKKASKEEIKEEEKLINLSLRNQRSETDRKTWESFLDGLSTKISKPSVETWFNKSFCLIRGNTIFIYFISQFNAEWAISRFESMINDCFSEFCGIDTNEYKVIYDHIKDEE